MAIMLGNLSTAQIEERLGVEFPEEVREFMNKTRQAEAQNIKPGKWHCFDMPFTWVCGDRETATRIYEGLKDQSDNMKTTLKIAIG